MGINWRETQGETVRARIDPATTKSSSASVMRERDHEKEEEEEDVNDDFTTQGKKGPSSSLKDEYQKWPKFTSAEVKRHDKLNDGWIIIHSRVYDITAFAKTHPGFNNAGQVSTALAIARSLGTDATEEFTAIHSATAWKQLKDFQIGVVCRPEDEGTLAETEEAPKDRPIPKWLSNDRDFWVRYSGGVDEAVLRYLTKNGYPQGEGRQDDDDDEAPPPPPPNPPPKVKVVRSAPKKGVTVVRSAPKTEPAARSLRVDEKQAIGDDDETAAALRTMLKQARKLGDDALVTSLQQQLFEMGAETRRIELDG